jgi:hypothetical protein
MEEDYTHRDLCASTAGLLEAFKNQSQEDRNELDEHTVDEMIRFFNEKHDEHGAETPKPIVE